LFIHSGQFYQVEASVENFKGDELTAVVSRGNPSNKTSAVSRQKAAPRNFAASLRTKKDTRKFLRCPADISLFDSSYGKRQKQSANRFFNRANA
jgi:hypothetical protein